MAKAKRIGRKACIAIAILGIAFAAAPTATAGCLGHEPVWWDDKECSAMAEPILWDDWYICVSNNPVKDCL